MSPTQSSLSLLHLFELFMVQCLFAFLPSLSKIAFRSFSPEIILFFRIAGCSLLFAVIFFFFMYEKVTSLKDYFYFALLGFLGVVGNQYLFLKGVSFSTAINASIIITTIPIFTLIIASLVSQERITLLKFLGIFISLSGVLSILEIDKFALSGYMAGNLMILSNSLLYSIYLVMAKPVLSRYHPFTVMTYVFLFSTIECLPFCYYDLINTKFSMIPTKDYIVPIIIVLFSTFAPYLLNTIALKHINSSIVAIFIYTQPLFGTLFAIILLSEILTAGTILSGILIMTGVALATIRIKNKANRLK